MKYWYLIPLAGIAGMVVGQWGPRERLRALEEVRAEASAQKEKPRRTGFDDLTQLVNIPKVAKRPNAAHGVKPAGRTGNVPCRRESGSRSPNGPRIATNEAVNVKAESATMKPVRPAEKLNPEDLRARIAEAQQLWGTRVELARATWKEKLKLADGESEKFDAVLDEMNEKLYDTMSTFATQLAQKSEISPEIGIKFISDATAILGETYEAMGAAVAPELRETVSTMPVADFIDPGVVEPLVEVQDKLRNFNGFGGAQR